MLPHRHWPMDHNRITGWNGLGPFIGVRNNKHRTHRQKISLLPCLPACTRDQHVALLSCFVFSFLPVYSETLWEWKSIGVIVARKWRQNEKEEEKEREEERRERA